MPFTKPNGQRDYKREINEQGRTCTCCSIFKSWEEFSWKRPSREEGKPEIHKQKQPKCKVCAKQDTKDWNNRNKDSSRDRYLKRTYGISEKEYQAMLLNQNNKCLFCNTEFTVGEWGPDSPVVDHCHTKGHVRGILCNECNRGLGYFHDNPEVLKKAAQYLEDN